MSLTVTNPSYDRVYTMYAWRDNNNRLVLTQGEGATTLDGTVTRIKAPRFQLRDDQGVMNLSGSPVISLALTRPDKSEDLLACTIIDAANGIVSCPITASATAIAGQAVGEIRLSSTNGTIKFFGVHALIYDGVSNSAAAQSTQFSALVDALQKVATVDPDGSNTVTLDSAIVENGTNPVASGVIYDYLNGNFYTKTQSDDKFQILANKAQTIDSNTQTTTADAQKYPSVAAVKDFLYANFYTDDEVDDLLDLVYSKTAADDLFATKANTYTKSEINAIQTENDKRFELQTTVGFDENGIPVFTSNNTSFSAGSCTVNNIKTLFIASNVRLLQGGAFTTNSTGIEVVFIDNEQSGIAIQSGAFPSGATIYYKGQFNALGFVIDAIVAIKPRIMSITIPTSGWSNNEYDITSLMPPSANANTRVDVSIGASVQEQLVADGCGGIYASTDTSNSITTFTLHAMYNKPTANITVQLTLTQLVSV